jgi:hypothetical protein
MEKFGAADKTFEPKAEHSPLRYRTFRWHLLSTRIAKSQRQTPDANINKCDSRSTNQPSSSHRPKKPVRGQQS